MPQKLDNFVFCVILYYIKANKENEHAIIFKNS